MFGFFKKKKIQNKSSNSLHGFDLDIWNYLGYTTIRFVGDNDVVTSKATVFFFCKKDDYNKRSYYLQKTGYSSFDNHVWLYEVIPLWMCGEKSLYTIVRNEPSIFLKQYMLEHHDNEWCDETKWWISTENAKYKSAVINNKKEKTTPVKTENNIIFVDFTKK